MKFIIQRVKKASVEVNNDMVSSIDKGFLVFIGIKDTDGKLEADYLVKKLINLRIFEDDKGKMNLSLKDINGELLIVSQFTLYANCSNGNRPSFTEAAKSEYANELYEYIVKQCREKVKVVKTGIFGEDMQVGLINDGPVTIILEK